MKQKAMQLAISVALGIACATPGMAQTDAPAAAESETVQTAMEQKMAAMQQQIDALQKQLDALKRQQAQADSTASVDHAGPSGDAVAAAEVKGEDVVDPGAGEEVEDAEAVAAAPPPEEDGITLGGAMRFQYSFEDYNQANTQRIGDLDFDIFRLDLHGKVHGITLDAQWRWFQYMSAMQHAWIAYDFNDTSQVQLGLTRIPFGNQPYNSHNYFFSSNYYLGLEDTHAMGIEYVYSGSLWNVQLAYFKNDGMGGVDGYVSDRTESYSYNIVGVREPGEDIYAEPSHPAASYDTVAARVARNFTLGEDVSIETGVSALRGGIRDATSNIGDYYAWALHLNADYKNWNFQAQASRYDYSTDNNASIMAVGAYAFYDSIAARADSYTLNVAYHLPVDWGPVAGLDFYNDYSLITNKSGGLPDTWMNILGVAFSAGDLYTYFDYVRARNQPFIGGSMAGDGGVEQRFNINFGFYF